MTSQSELTVTLKYTHRELESIYFGKGQGNFLQGQFVKQRLLILAVALIAIPVSMWRAQADELPIWVMGAVFGTLLAVFVLYLLAAQAWKLYQWKKSVYRLISRLDETSETIECSGAAISFITDIETVILRWQCVRQITIRDQYISVVTETESHILPARCMDATAFQQLTEVLKMAVAGFPAREPASDSPIQVT